MATETEKLYETQTGAGTGVTDTTAQATTPAATSPYVTGNQSLDNYNNARYDQINNLYDANRDAALAQRESAFNRNMSDAQAAYDKITPAYQEARNESGAEYERQRRNNNLQAAANGINTGAGSQMQLASSNVYQSNQAQLQKAEKDALAEAERQQLTMKEQYKADVAEALAKNDSERAAALLNDYGQQYDRMMNEAKTLAAYGDFSLYKTLYGDAAAKQMEQTWLLQNPKLAYTLGKITAEQYFKMTGSWPPGYDTGSTAGYGGGYGYSGGYSGGGNNPDSTKDATGKWTANASTVQKAMNAGYSMDEIKAGATNPTTAEALYKTLSAMENYSGTSAQEAQNNRNTVKEALTTAVNNAKTTYNNAVQTQNKGATLTKDYVKDGKVRSGIM